MMVPRPPLALAAFLALLQLVAVSVPRPVAAQSQAPAPPEPPASQQPTIPRRPGAEALGPMRIDGSTAPPSQADPSPRPPQPTKRPASPRPHPGFAVEDGVIFEPQMEEDLYQRPKLKGMFRWDLDKLRVPR